MKIGCDACERAEAAVLCCADEAALCRSCDAAVHSANKLAARHHRVALLPSSTAHPPSSTSPTVDDGSGGGSGGHPACDICQEKTGYFFCLEDRALLCRPCDVAVHAAGVHVASHRRFLITGVRVGDVESLSHGVPVPGSDGGASPSTTSSGNGSSSAPCSSSGGGNPMTTTTTMPDQVRPSSSSSIRATAATTEVSPGQWQQWLWSDFLADDVGVGVGVDMEEECCHAELSEPGSSGLTRS